MKHDQLFCVYLKYAVKLIDLQLCTLKEIQLGNMTCLCQYVKVVKQITTLALLL